jgi:hypothetical protein
VEESAPPETATTTFSFALGNFSFFHSASSRFAKSVVREKGFRL